MGFLRVAFYVASAIYFILLFCSIFCLIRSYFNHRYRMTANPQQLIEFERGMREHYTVAVEEGKSVDDEVKRELQECLIEQYTKASEQNRQRNLQRTNWLFRTTGFIIATFGMMIVSKLLFFAVHDTTPKPQEVKITAMPDNQKIGVTFPDVQKVQVTAAPARRCQSPPQSRTSEGSRAAEGGDRRAAARAENRSHRTEEGTEVMANNPNTPSAPSNPGQGQGAPTPPVPPPPKPARPNTIEYVKGGYKAPNIETKGDQS